MRTFVREILIGVVVALAIYLGIQFTLQQFVVQQISMMPNLVEGQRLFVNKIAYLFHGPERGDIIVFRTSQNPNEIPLIKRVIGLPGEAIEIKSGIVYVNGSALVEPYIKDQPQYVLQSLPVEAKNYFVLGDNRNYSRDSHGGWTVPEDNIVGKAWISVWPPKTWGLIPDYAYAYK
jgi:signal peptidase I